MTYYVAGIVYGNDLYHHGVKGQKWGIRRYQNADGSLTAEGKARYGTESLTSNSHSLLRRIASRDYGPLKNNMLRGKLEESRRNKAEKLKAEGANQSKIDKAERKAKAQEQKNVDYEKYTANTSTGKLIAQALITPFGGFGGRKYREARARGAGRIRSWMSSAFFITPVGFTATKLSEKKKYGSFVHSDISGDQDDELYHWGIKGQKWGIRRYQNADGTLTPEGKERYREHPEEAAKYVTENWINAYNKGVDEANVRLKDLNKKYEGIDFNKDNEAYEKYNKEFKDMQDEVFGKAFDTEFGEITETAGLGRDWGYRYLRSIFGVD